MNISPTPLSRRMLLKASGISMALPLLHAMGEKLGAKAQSPQPRRMVAINTNLGILSDHFYPEKSGSEFELTPYLEPLKELRDQFSIISGCSHPDVTGGHSAEVSFLTAAPHPGAVSFRNSISLDQFAAQYIGEYTRIPTLTLNVSKKKISQSLSFTNSGVMIPAESSPSSVFKTLFLSGNQEDIDRRIHDLRVGRSILDTVAQRASSLKKKLGAADKERLDQYYTSVREVERRLHIAEEWEHKPKPKVEAPIPIDQEYLPEKLATIYDLIHLALTTDSTRLVTLLIKLDGFSSHIPGVRTESHNLSHHVGRKDKLVELKYLELAQFRALANFLSKLHETPDGQTSRTLLDQTQVLYGSNLGNGNNHDTHNLPVLLAGGDFKHGQHLAFDRKKNTPFCNVQLSMLQQLGIEVDQFASSRGTLTGL